MVDPDKYFPKDEAGKTDNQIMAEQTAKRLNEESIQRNRVQFNSKPNETKSPVKWGFGVMVGVFLFFLCLGGGILGTCVCGIGGAAKITDEARKDYERRKAEIEKQKATPDSASATPDFDPTAPETPMPSEPPVEWAAIGTPSTIGDYSVMITAARIGKVKLTMDQISVEPQLAITILIENKTERKKTNYETFRDSGFGVVGATLKDDADNSYKRITYGFASSPEGGVISSESIYPKKSITDILVFEKPIDATDELFLELPGENLGVEGRFRLKIPIYAIKRE